MTPSDHDTTLATEPTATAAVIAEPTHMTHTPMTMTPPRHNYANPLTPIASIKRPRASLQGLSSSSKQPPPSSSSSQSQAAAAAAASSSYTPPPPSSSQQALSPMHPVRAVHRSSSATTTVVATTTAAATTTTTTATTTPTTTLAASSSQSSSSQSNNTAATSTAAWVGAKVDALFSPVLRFLDQQQAPQVPVPPPPVPADDDEQTNKSVMVMVPDNDTATTATAESDQVDNHMHDCLLLDAADHIIVEEQHQDHDNNCNSSTASADDNESLQGQSMPIDADDFNPWQFIQSLPPYHTVQHLRPPTPALPPKTCRHAITLVLDLDETLVHCSVDTPTDYTPDVQFPVQFHGQSYLVHVRLRPFLQPFLEYCAQHFEVVLFTASQKIYAHALLQRIDPDGKYIQHSLFRESCLALEGNFLKDLNVLGRDLRHTILVDNSPHAFGYQVDNGIPIESWFDDMADAELCKLQRFLSQQFAVMGGVDDVRPILRHKFKCRQLVAAAPPVYYNTTRMMGRDDEQPDDDEQHDDDDDQEDDDQEARP